jgi:hypothetical protein
MRARDGLNGWLWRISQIGGVLRFVPEPSRLSLTYVTESPKEIGLHDFAAKPEFILLKKRCEVARDDGLFQ